MSGLEPLAALGLACNIFQVISFGRDAIQICKSLYQTGEIDPDLQSHAEILHDISARVRIPEGSGRRPADDRSLITAAKRCEDAAKDLQEEVKFILDHATKGSLSSTLKVAAKTAWRKRRLESLTRRLNEIQTLMESGLLVRICNRSDAMHVKIDSLDDYLQSFVRQYQAGHRHLSGLVSIEAQLTRAHITEATSKAAESLGEAVESQIKQSEKALEGYIQKSSEKTSEQLQRELRSTYERAQEDIQRENLLKSLKYAGMNERKNQIQMPHQHTFQWLVDDQADSDDAELKPLAHFDGPSPDIGLLELDEDLHGYFDGRGGIYDEDHSPDRASLRSQYGSDDNIELGPSDEEENVAWVDYIWSSKRDNPVAAPALQPDSFLEWLRSTGGIYWISGKAGSGKTTLVKYLMSNPKTTVLLKKNNMASFIISHFFWRPGNKLQQTTKGFLLSLLHQLLVLSKDALRHVIGLTDVLSKDSDADWSVEELQSTCEGALRSLQKPVCVFVDGLDEINLEDGAVQFLERVRHIQEAAPGTKFCISSRPEPHIKRRLSQFPHLRLQDLTFQDMRRFAEDTIKYPKEYEARGYSYRRESLHESLVRKAEGVFLWLRLVVESVNRGFDNGDKLTEIIERIESLPSDLTRLYHDMWRRLNDDQVIYRQKAALYMRLVILCREASEIWTSTTEHISVLEMMLISSKFGDLVLSEKHDIPAGALVKECEETIRQVRLRCAGLLDVGSGLDADFRDFGSHTWSGGRYEDLIPYALGMQTFKFIHRTAFDFMTDTCEGQEILGFDRTPESKLFVQLIRSGLAARKLCHFQALGIGNEGPNYAFPESEQNTVENFLSILSPMICLSQGSMTEEMIEDLPNLLKDINPEEVMDTISYCEQLYEDNRLFAICGRSAQLHTNEYEEFLPICASFSLDDYILKALSMRELSTNLKTDILLGASQVRKLVNTDSKAILIQQLLKDGADPNSHGTLLPMPMAYCYELASPFGVILKSTLRMYGSQPNSHVNSVKNDWIKALTLFDVILQHGAILDELVLVVFCIGPERTVAVQEITDIPWLGYKTRGRPRPVEGRYFLSLFPAWHLMEIWLKEAVKIAAMAQGEYNTMKATISSLDEKIRQSRRTTTPQVIATFDGNYDYRKGLIMHRCVQNQDSELLLESMTKILQRRPSKSDGQEILEIFDKAYDRGYYVPRDLVDVLISQGIVSAKPRIPYATLE